MSVETTELRQKAVLWARTGVDASADPTFGSPIEIDTRWEDAQGNARGQKGESESRSVTVFVDREISLGSKLWLGELADLPASPTGLIEVVAYDAVPDLKARHYRRTVRGNLL